MLLTPAELVDLTGYKQPAAQVRALSAMGIAYRVRPDGKPIVTWEGVNGLEKQVVEPRFTAIDRVG